MELEKNLRELTFSTYPASGSSAYVLPLQTQIRKVCLRVIL